MPNSPKQKQKQKQNPNPNPNPNPTRPNYIYIFNDLLIRHNNAMPKYFLPKVGANERQRATSVSFSNTSTRSLDPAKAFSYTTTSNAPTITATSTTTKISSSDVSNKSYSTSPTSTSPSYTQDSQMPDNRLLSSRDILRQLERMSPQGSPRNVTSTNYKLPLSVLMKSPSITTSTSSRLPQSSSQTVAKLSSRSTTNKVRLPPPKVALKDKDGSKNTRSSGPNVSQTPTAVLGNSSAATANNGDKRLMRSQQQQHDQHHQHTSMAKIIAAQTPNAFKTLGPGFNIRAPAEKSFTANLASSLGASNLPSDYEHIFHAPSQISNLQDSNQNSEKKAGRHRHRSKTLKKS